MKVLLGGKIILFESSILSIPNKVAEYALQISMKISEIFIGFLPNISK